MLREQGLPDVGVPVREQTADRFDHRDRRRRGGDHHTGPKVAGRTTERRRSRRSHRQTVIAMTIHDYGLDCHWYLLDRPPVMHSRGLREEAPDAGVRGSSDECTPQPSCPKVVRLVSGVLVVVGAREPGADGRSVTIDASLLATALERLEAAPPYDAPSLVIVVGIPVTDPEEQLGYGVGEGEGAVVVSECAFRALAHAGAA
jgi:hypothetical protein